MPRLYVVRRNQRKGLYIPMAGTKDSPSLMFFLPKTDPGHLDQLVRSQLEKQGITKESDVHAVIEQAEKDYEQRLKTEEAAKEVRRLLQIRAMGGKIMQFGFRKWKQCFYPARNKEV